MSNGGLPSGLTNSTARSSWRSAHGQATFPMGCTKLPLSACLQSRRWRASTHT